MQQAQFSDAIFTQILHWRLGMHLATPVRRCCNVKANDDPCEEVLGDFGDHALTCAGGPLRIQRHDAHVDGLSECIVEAGAHVQREAAKGLRPSQPSPPPQPVFWSSNTTHGSLCSTAPVGPLCFGCA